MESGNFVRKKTDKGNADQSLCIISVRSSRSTRRTWNGVTFGDPVTRFRVCRQKPELYLFQDSLDFLTGFHSTIGNMNAIEHSCNVIKNHSSSL